MELRLAFYNFYSIRFKQSEFTLVFHNQLGDVRIISATLSFAQFLDSIIENCVVGGLFVIFDANVAISSQNMFVILKMIKSGNSLFFGHLQNFNSIFFHYTVRFYCTFHCQDNFKSTDCAVWPKVMFIKLYFSFSFLKMPEIA